MDRLQNRVLCLRSASQNTSVCVACLFRYDVAGNTAQLMTQGRVCCETTRQILGWEVGSDSGIKCWHFKRKVRTETYPRQFVFHTTDWWRKRIFAVVLPPFLEHSRREVWICGISVVRIFRDHAGSLFVKCFVRKIQCTAFVALLPGLQLRASLIILMLSLDRLWEVPGSGGGLTNMKIVGAS
jgi:hypothetical protein